MCALGCVRVCNCSLSGFSALANNREPDVVLTLIFLNESIYTQPFMYCIVDTRVYKIKPNILKLHFRLGTTPVSFFEDKRDTCFTLSCNSGIIKPKLTRIYQLLL